MVSPSLEDRIKAPSGRIAQVATAAGTFLLTAEALAQVVFTQTNSTTYTNGGNGYNATGVATNGTNVYITSGTDITTLGGTNLQQVSQIITDLSSSNGMNMGPTIGQSIKLTFSTSNGFTDVSTTSGGSSANYGPTNADIISSAVTFSDGQTRQLYRNTTNNTIDIYNYTTGASTAIAGLSGSNLGGLAFTSNGAAVVSSNSFGLLTQSGQLLQYDLNGNNLGYTQNLNGTGIFTGLSVNLSAGTWAAAGNDGGGISGINTGTFVAVPEPSTEALLIAGIATVALYKRGIKAYHACKQSVKSWFSGNE